MKSSYLHQSIMGAMLTFLGRFSCDVIGRYLLAFTVKFRRITNSLLRECYGMASILKVDGKWRAQIRRKGHKSIAQSFDSKQDAEKWARKLEREMDAEKYHDGRTLLTFADVADRYEKEMEYGRSAANVMKHLRTGLGKLTLDKITPHKVVEYIQGREYGAATATVELSVLGTMLKVARVVWRMPIKEGVTQDARLSLKLVGKVGKSKQRDRRPTKDELDRLCAYFDKRSTLPMRDVIYFAIYTAMRSSEISRLRWDDLHEADKTILIRDRKDPNEKIGNDQTVPVLANAMEIILRQPRTGELIFPHNSKTISSIWPRACRELKIEDLRFHDLRHEGVSRLFEMGYQIHEVALFSGHKDWKMLRRYTQLRAKDLRRL